MKVNEFEFKDSKVLIVDDSPENLRILGSFLISNGYKVAVARDGNQVISAAENFRPDCILMDVNMPIMDGYEATRLLKAHPELDDVPVIFTTALSETEEIVKGFEEGGADYIIKPFNIKELLKRVENQIKLKKFNDLVIKKNLELEQANESKDKFFSIISHDLRGPFTGTLGLSEMIIENADAFEKKDILDLISKIYNAQKNQLALLNNLLDWSRVQLGRIEFNPEVIDIEAFFKNIVGIFAQSAENKRIDLEYEINTKKSIFADEFLISTITRNLLNNAIKFTHLGGSIKLIAEDYKENSLKIIIQDNGVGLSEEDKNKLFKIDIHMTKIGTGKEKGTGLGLVLCKEYAELNGGIIGVDSELGEGSKFYFTTPSKD